MTELSGSYWVWVEPGKQYESLGDLRVADGMQPCPHEGARLYVPAARWLPGAGLQRSGLPEDWPMEGD